MRTLRPALVRRVSSATGGGRSEVEDVVAKVWYTAFLKRLSYGGSGSPAAWVFAIARTEILMHLRGRRRNKLTTAHTEGLDQWAGSMCVTTVWDAYDAHQEARKAFVRALLAQLPPKQARICMARLFEDKSYKEIAAECGVQTGTARASFRDALRRLRELASAGSDYTLRRERHLDLYGDWYLMLLDASCNEE